MDGWIKLSRSILEEEDYFTKPFTRKEAILDLYLLAAIKDGEVTVNGKQFKVRKGQIITTVRILARRWGWKKSTVYDFFKRTLFRTYFRTLSNPIITCISVKSIDADLNISDTLSDTLSDTNINKNVYLEEFIIDTRAREDRLEKEAQQLADDQVWLESIMMNHHIPPDGIPPLLSAFVTECKCNGLDSHGSIADTKRHFNSWLRIKLKEKHEQDTRNRPSPEDNRREAEWAAAVRTANAIRGTNEIVDDLPMPF